MRLRAWTKDTGANGAKALRGPTEAVDVAPNSGSDCPKERDMAPRSESEFGPTLARDLFVHAFTRGHKDREDVVICGIVPLCSWRLCVRTWGRGEGCRDGDSHPKVVGCMIARITTRREEAHDPHDSQPRHQATGGADA
jgi:hypothetical protein